MCWTRWSFATRRAVRSTHDRVSIPRCRNRRSHSLPLTAHRLDRANCWQRAWLWSSTNNPSHWTDSPSMTSATTTPPVSATAIFRLFLVLPSSGYPSSCHLQAIPRLAIFRLFLVLPSSSYSSSCHLRDSFIREIIPNDWIAPLKTNVVLWQFSVSIHRHFIRSKRFYSFFRCMTLYSKWIGVYIEDVTWLDMTRDVKFSQTNDCVKNLASSLLLPVNGLRHAFVLVQISRFQQIIGVHTLLAPSESVKVSERSHSLWSTSVNSKIESTNSWCSTQNRWVCGFLWMTWRHQDENFSYIERDPCPWYQQSCRPDIESLLCWMWTFLQEFLIDCHFLSRVDEP